MHPGPAGGARDEPVAFYAMGCSPGSWWGSSRSCFLITGEPTTAPASVTPILIWLATLSALGILNAVLVYVIAAVVPSESRAMIKP
jgi:hypothetical protein